MWCINGASTDITFSSLSQRMSWAITLHQMQNGKMLILFKLIKCEQKYLNVSVFVNFWLICEQHWWSLPWRALVLGPVMELTWCLFMWNVWWFIQFVYKGLQKCHRYLWTSPWSVENNNRTFAWEKIISQLFSQFMTST